MRTRRVLLYADLDVSMIDGSSIWLVSAAEVLARAGCTVTLLLHRPSPDRRLLRPLETIAGVEVLDPMACPDLAVPHLRSGGRAMNLEDAASAVESLANSREVDAVLVRGSACVRRLAQVPALRGKLWSYLTDIPQSVGLMSDEDRAWLSDVAQASAVVLCQTEGLRALLEWSIPETSGKCELWTPIAVAPAVVRDEVDGPLGDAERPLRLGYIGKCAPMWNTLEMARLPASLRARGVHASVEVFGDKIHRAPEVPGWHEAMRDALVATRDVHWHGGMARDEALRGVARTHVGLAWRSPALDGSLELSTKLLEYGVLRMPAVVNRTRMHEEMLGTDYPLFVDEGADATAAIVLAAASPGARRLASERLAAAAEGYSMEHAVPRVRNLVQRLLPDGLPQIRSRAASAGRPLRLVVSGYDMKFISKLCSRWAAMEGVEVKLDVWRDAESHDADWSSHCLEWADVIVCEWCLGNAAWYSRRRREGQRLIVRLHRFELDTAWPNRLHHAHVDAMVCVSPEYASRAATAMPELAARITTIPNWIDVSHLDRPKLEGADRTLGMIGIARAHKGLGVALDILAAVRTQDPEFRLEIKSELPWRLPWLWRRRSERGYFERVMARIGEDPMLNGSVTFIEPGSDVATWVRRVGWLLSTSEAESFHLGPAEGAASRAVPVMLEWPGVKGVHDAQWIHGSASDAARWIVEKREAGIWAGLGEAARDFVSARYSLESVLSSWTTLLAAGEELSGSRA